MRGKAYHWDWTVFLPERVSWGRGGPPEMVNLPACHLLLDQCWDRTIYWERAGYTVLPLYHLPALSLLPFDTSSMWLKVPPFFSEITPIWRTSFKALRCDMRRSWNEEGEGLRICTPPSKHTLHGLHDTMPRTAQSETPKSYPQFEAWWCSLCPCFSRSSGLCFPESPRPGLMRSPVCVPSTLFIFLVSLFRVCVVSDGGFTYVSIEAGLAIAVASNWTHYIIH